MQVGGGSEPEEERCRRAGLDPTGRLPSSFVATEEDYLLRVLVLPVSGMWPNLEASAMTAAMDVLSGINRVASSTAYCRLSGSHAWIMKDATLQCWDCGASPPLGKIGRYKNLPQWRARLDALLADNAQGVRSALSDLPRSYPTLTADGYYNEKVIFAPDVPPPGDGLQADRILKTVIWLSTVTPRQTATSTTTYGWKHSLDGDYNAVSRDINGYVTNGDFLAGCLIAGLPVWLELALNIRVGISPSASGRHHIKHLPGRSKPWQNAKTGLKAHLHTLSQWEAA